MDLLLKEAKLLWKLAEMVEGEHEAAIQELNLASGQLMAKKARVDMAKASMVVTSACLA